MLGRPRGVLLVQHTAQRCGVPVVPQARETLDISGSLHVRPDCERCPENHRCCPQELVAGLGFPL